MTPGYRRLCGVCALLAVALDAGPQPCAAQAESTYRPGRAVGSVLNKVFRAQGGQLADRLQQRAPAHAPGGYYARQVRLTEDRPPNNSHCRGPLRVVVENKP